jgi:hypothetical protein
MNTEYPAEFRICPPAPPGRMLSEPLSVQDDTPRHRIARTSIQTRPASKYGTTIADRNCCLASGSYSSLLTEQTDYIAQSQVEITNGSIKFTLTCIETSNFTWNAFATTKCSGPYTFTCTMNPYIRKKISSVRLEVFTAVTMKNGVFWDVTTCGCCNNRRFGGT